MSVCGVVRFLQAAVFPPPPPKRDAPVWRPLPTWHCKQCDVTWRGDDPECWSCGQRVNA